MQNKPTVLIADDSPLVRYQLVDIFEDLGFDIIGEVSNGNEAIILYKEKKPDFVTLDILMPEKSGLETLEEIIKLNPAAKIIMITALGKQEIISKCLKKGASDFILKPFNPLLIKETFNRLMKF
ncbi:response regulator [Candidatus Dependentiae bacterium]|nr:response regulator [Candidatus Dependentiae bacterium]